MKVENKVVIVTGAGSGIGAASAKLFAQHGAKVVSSDINLESAKATAKTIQDNGGEAIAVQTNVTKYEEVQHLINHTVEYYGRLDSIVNNAGIGPKNMVKTHEHTMADWENVIAVNQTGVFYCMKLALEKMVAQG